MDDEEIDAAINYAEIYENALLNMFESMGCILIDCEIGIPEEGIQKAEYDTQGNRLSLFESV